MEKIHKIHLAYTQARNALWALIFNLHHQFERQIENPKVFWNYAGDRMKICPAIGSIEGIIDGMQADKEKSNCT